jgi:predicted PurR-regulated permease PerM
MQSPTSRHPFFIGLLGAASLGFFAILFGFWRPIFWAAVIGILFRPVQKGLTARLNGRASLAAVLTLTLIVVTVLVPAMLLASAVAAEGAKLYERVQSREINLAETVQWLKDLFPQADEWAAGVGLNLEQLPERLSAAVVEGSEFIASLALSAGQNVASFVLMFFLMLYLLFFILRDGSLIMRHVHRAMPLPDDLERQLFSKFAEVSRATIKGTLVVGLVQGFLGGLIFAILGIQGAVFWGVVMALLSLLPAVGAGLVWAPAAVILAVKGDWTGAVVLTAYGVLVIGLADNLLRPILVGRDTKMPDYLILFSTLGGLGLVGITGFVLGPVLAALFIATWQIYEQDRSAPPAGGADPDAGAGSTAADPTPAALAKPAGGAQ